jgi:hypothetical protein
LKLYQDDDGFWVMRGRFTPEQGALIAKALDAANDQLFAEQKQVPDEVTKEIEQNLPQDQVVPEAFASRRADAMERVAENFLAGALMEGSISLYPMAKSFQPVLIHVSAGTSWR